MGAARSHYPGHVCRVLPMFVGRERKATQDEVVLAFPRSRDLIMLDNHSTKMQLIFDPERPTKRATRTKTGQQKQLCTFMCDP